MTQEIIRFNNVQKIYRVRFAHKSLIAAVMALFRKNDRVAREREVMAINGVTISIKKGEAVGIIGENASGKTTFLRLISKITFPNKGEVRVAGRVAGLLDLGAGFHPELTGRENVYLHAALLGMKRRQINDNFAKIVDFSGVENFIDAPVKTYSQGMLVRLGFAIAAHLEPDIFLVDDSLAVGDEEFQRKCLKKISELKEKGKTIIIVSHDLDALSKICDRGILLKDGKVLKDDCLSKVILRYVEAVGDKNAVAFLDREKLGVIFNSGKIVLLWDGRPLTKNFGGYASLRYQDKWVMSWQIPWRIVSRGEDNFTAEAWLAKYKTKLTLSGLVLDPRNIELNLELDFAGEDLAQKAGFGFMLSDKYSQYYREGQLQNINPEESDSGQWADIYRSDESGAILALAGAEQLPVFMTTFEQKNAPGFNLIQNAGGELSSPVAQIQMRPLKTQGPEQEKTGAIVCRARIKLPEAEEFTRIMREKEQSRWIESGSLKVQLKDRSFRIFYANTELTRNSNIRFGFFSREKFYDLFNAEWEMNKETSSRLVLRAWFNDLDLEFKVLLELEPEQIRWQVVSSGRGQLVLNRLQMKICLAEDYSRYCGLNSESAFNPASEHAEQIRLLDKSLAGMISDKMEFPELVFSAEAGSALELQNSSFDRPARMLIQEKSDTDKISGTIQVFTSPDQRKAFLSRKQQESAMENSLSQEDLRLEFSAQETKLFNRDDKITAGEGFCSGIYYKDRWYESREFSRATERNGDLLKTLITRRIPALEERWEIRMEQGEIFWQVSLKALENIDGISFKFGMILDPAYTHWAHSFGEGAFPDIRTQVMDIDDVNNNLLAVKSGEGSFPGVVFEKLFGESSGVILEKKDEGIGLAFKFMNFQKLKAGESVSFSAAKIKVLDLKQWAEALMSHRTQEFSLVAGNGLRVFASSQGIELGLQEKNILQREGLGITLISADGGYHDSHFARRKIRKINGNQLAIDLSWEDKMLSLTWVFDATAQGFTWTIFCLAAEAIDLKELIVHLFPDDSRKFWFTEKEQGIIDFHGQTNDSIALFDNRSRFFGVRAEESAWLSPALVMMPEVDMREWFMHICRHPREQISACGFNQIVDLQNNRIDPGKHQIFRSSFLLAQNPDLGMPSPSEDTPDHWQIKQGKLALRIESAKARLFWEGKELTKTLCLYTSFLNRENWFDSTLARWDVRILEDRINVTLGWNKTRVLQEWELEIVNENEICWQVRTNVKEQDVNLVEAAIMLNEGYDTYQCDEDSPARFPEEFKRGAFRQLSSFQKKAEASTRSGNFPKIIFHASLCGKENLTENSDDLHLARVLKSREKLVPGEKADELCGFSKINIKIGE